MPERPRLSLEEYRRNKAEMVEKFSEKNIRKLLDDVDEHMRSIPREQGPSSEYLNFRHTF